jgi:hypothetical protein
MRRIAANEQLWRAGVAVHLLYLMLTVPMSVLLYRLLQFSGPTLARIALVSSLMCSTIEVASLPLTVAPLMAAGSPTLAAFTSEQLNALGYLSIRLFSAGFGFAILMFSSFCALTGLLILRSRLIARPIGYLMIVGGIGYFAQGLVRVLAPLSGAQLLPLLLLPGFVAELSLALYLLIAGVNGTAWAAGQESLTVRSS